MVAKAKKPESDVGQLTGRDADPQAAAAALRQLMQTMGGAIAPRPSAVNQEPDDPIHATRAAATPEPADYSAPAAPAATPGTVPPAATPAPAQQAAIQPQSMPAVAPNETTAAIIASAQKNGIDPAFALAVAQRESSLNPNAGGTGTIKGLFQMTKKLRGTYGLSEEAGAGEQSDAFGQHYAQIHKEMSPILGRDPTDQEVYLGHHFGGARAARMVASDEDTPVNEIFTPRELSGNPHIVKAGTSKALIDSVSSDIDRRRSGFGWASASQPDFSQLADSAD